MNTATDNPLRHGIHLEQTAEPCAVVIFGASGDLTKRKLIPALYRLVQLRLLPAEFAIVGQARTAMAANLIIGAGYPNRTDDLPLTRRLLYP